MLASYIRQNKMNKTDNDSDNGKTRQWPKTLLSINQLFMQQEILLSYLILDSDVLENILDLIHKEDGEI